MAGRASNGESTIYKAADGRWHGYVSVGFTLDGKLDRRHVSSKSRGVVVAKVRDLERKRDSGIISETSTPTVAWWLEHWLTTLAQRASDVATALDLGEARAVLDAAAGVRNSARWTVALALGLRQSEAMALQWKDVDPLAGTLTVRRSIHRVRGGGLIYEEPKTRRSHRTLALPLPPVAELHRHKAAQLGERMLAGSEWHDEDLVFAQANGRPIDKKADYDDWTRLLHKAGVRHVRLHDGRHTAATLLLGENVHPRVVMELLGHSQMRTTM